MSNNYFISTDKTLLNPSVIHTFLSNCYWAKGIPYDNVVKRIQNAMCFGVYEANKNQVGFARVITDTESFAYLADVFILPDHRGLGLSKKLMAFITQQSELQNIKRFMLATVNAHGLYEQFGFKSQENTDRWMEIINFKVYKP